MEKRLTHSRLCLAEDVHAKDGLGDALLLDLGGVLETQVRDGAQELGLEEEVAEAGRVDADVGTLLVLGVGSGGVSLAIGRGGGGSRRGGLEDILLVVCARGRGRVLESVTWSLAVGRVAVNAPMRSSVGRVDLWCEGDGGRGGSRWTGSGRGRAGVRVVGGTQCEAED